jgi:hypothetical protein
MCRSLCGKALFICNTFSYTKKYMISFSINFLLVFHNHSLYLHFWMTWDVIFSHTYLPSIHTLCIHFLSFFFTIELWEYIVYSRYESFVRYVVSKYFLSVCCLSFEFFFSFFKAMSHYIVRSYWPGTCDSRSAIQGFQVCTITTGCFNNFEGFFAEKN